MAPRIDVRNLIHQEISNEYIQHHGLRMHDLRGRDLYLRLPGCTGCLRLRLRGRSSLPLR